MNDPPGLQGLMGLFGDWREIVIACGLAVLGGLAKLAQMILNGKDKGATYVKRGTKLFLAGFAGLLFYWVTARWSVIVQWKALAIVLSGHMGAEAIDLLIQALKSAILRWAGAAQAPPRDQGDDAKNGPGV